MDMLLKVATSRLHDQGGRMTNQRLLILKSLEEMLGQKHPTAEEIYSTVKKRYPNIHLSTVYRTLRWLQEEGLVSSRFFEEDRRQERFDVVTPEDHNHFICTNCRQVLEFETMFLEDEKVRVQQDLNVVVKSMSFVLYGICSNCSLEDD